MANDTVTTATQDYSDNEKKKAKTKIPNKIKYIDLEG